MSRREIRRMLMTPKKRLRDKPWALPALMVAVLLAGLALGVGIGLLAGGNSVVTGPQPEALDRAPRRDEPPPEPLVQPPARPAVPLLVPVPQARPGGPADDGIYPEGEAGDAPAEIAALPMPVAPPAPPGPAMLPPGPAVPAWKLFAVPPPRTGGLPMIAVVIDDMGVDRKRSERTTRLRAPLTLAWLPYAQHLPEQTAAARQRGHELLLHVPMEPQGANFDPGPDVLQAALGSEEIRRRLDLGLGRFEGFVGINNHMGSRFTADADGMRVVMEEMHRRGLLFLDSVTTQKSVAPELARRYAVPFLSRNIFLDNEQTVTAVRGQLAKLEAHARKHGAAIAIGHPHDATIEALAGWLPTLEARGFALVPLTAILRGSGRD